MPNSKDFNIDPEGDGLLQSAGGSQLKRIFSCIIIYNDYSMSYLN
jgi:hypothetical protein